MTRLLLVLAVGLASLTANAAAKMPMRQLKATVAQQVRDRLGSTRGRLRISIRGDQFVAQRGRGGRDAFGDARGTYVSGKVDRSNGNITIQFEQP
jgi:hypothetical protein